MKASSTLTKKTKAVLATHPSKVRGAKVVVYFRGVQTIGTVTRGRLDRGGIYYVDVMTDAGVEKAAYHANQVAFIK